MWLIFVVSHFVWQDVVPAITCPADVEEWFGPPEAATTVLWPLPFASDTSRALMNIEQTEGPARGSHISAFTEGATKITYQGADHTGNLHTCSFTVNLLEVCFSMRLC